MHVLMYLSELVAQLSFFVFFLSFVLFLSTDSGDIWASFPLLLTLVQYVEVNPEGMLIGCLGF
jgi:uncharacterized ion transporter superfamily protein YfcC